MKVKIFGGLLVAALAITSIAQAQTHTLVINRHERNQERRINEGVRSGEITRGEAHHLRAEERNIRAEKRMAKLMAGLPRPNAAESAAMRTVPVVKFTAISTMGG